MYLGRIKKKKNLLMTCNICRKVHVLMAFRQLGTRTSHPRVQHPEAERGPCPEAPVPFQLLFPPPLSPRSCSLTSCSTR